MEPNKILSADLLDILFEGRNKEYGAYELRKTYNKRLTTSLLIMAGIALLVIGFLLMTGGHQPPDQFNTKEIYGFRNTTLSSLVVVIGFLVVLYSIFAKHISPQK